MDPIDREKLLSTIAEHERDSTAPIDYVGIIKSMPTVELKQQWIPCSERLPNTNNIYNVTRSVSDGFESCNITDACYFDGSDTWYDDTRINHERKYLTDVLAWCELPEPYREEGGE